MLNYLKLITLLSFGCLFAQEKKVETIYFDFDKYSIDSQQE